MIVSLVVTVETRQDGDCYFDRTDLVRHLERWIEDGLEDRGDLVSVRIAEAAPRPRYEETRGEPGISGD